MKNKRVFVGSILVTGVFLLFCGGSNQLTLSASPERVGYWRFDGDFSDSSGLSNHAVGYGAAFAAGRFGQGISLNGIDQWVEVPDASSLDLNDFTVEAWVKLDRFAVPQVIVEKMGNGEDASTNANYGLGIHETASAVVYFETTQAHEDQFLFSGAAVPLGQFFHVAGTYSSTSGELKIYVDGQLNGTIVVTKSPPNLNNFPILIGRGPSPNAFLKGVIDEVQIWNVARTQSEIQMDMDPVLTVTIDIKPGSYPNSINLNSAGVVLVAILSSSTFDATTVDPASVNLAGARIKLVGKSGRLLSHFEDVNDDHFLDLVCQVVTDQFLIQIGDSIAQLEGMTYGGIKIRGEDSINIVP